MVVLHEASVLRAAGDYKAYLATLKDVALPADRAQLPHSMLGVLEIIARIKRNK